jgi:hypothetical protein
MRDDIPTEWTFVEDCARTIEDIGKTGTEVVTSPHFGKWRDGYITLGTARALGASHVRLVSEPQPDFTIRIATVDFLFEATELLKPGRRRHDEYRAAETSGQLTQDDPEADWISEADFLKALRDRATSKCNKNYPSGCHLVIYINVGWIRSRKSIGIPLIEMFGIEDLRDAVGQHWKSLQGSTYFTEARLRNFKPLCSFQIDTRRRDYPFDYVTWLNA